MGTSDFTKDLWEDDSSTFDRTETEEYVRAKSVENEVSPSPSVEYLNNTVFPLVKKGIVEMFCKLKEKNSFQGHKGTFNGLDYLSEFLYNMNPNHPNRNFAWTYIFDMKWVHDYLKQRPRPYYRFHLVWSKQFAALKIQSYMRGHWVRCRPAIQELRQFWKAMKDERMSRNSENISIISNL